MCDVQGSWDNKQKEQKKTIHLCDIEVYSLVLH